MDPREEMTRHAESVDNNSLYTQPEDILKIYNRLSKISPYFSIAAGFGNVHGVYVCFGGSSTYLTNCSIIRNPATSSFIQSCSLSTKSTSLKRLAPQIRYVNTLLRDYVNGLKFSPMLYAEVTGVVVR